MVLCIVLVACNVAVLWAEMYLPPQLNKQHNTKYPALVDTSVLLLCLQHLVYDIVCPPL